ncbi:MAG: uracil-DNA glycosylase, partial [Candidatus Cloacimonetes bacterium]|nr:uracil-DNA glycosylase [Candidatus Cloacimonadota bacterium]
MKISELYKRIKKCNKCGLYETRINALCGEGNLKAKLMLIAQAPGENEDKQGRMFIGPSGKILDELLENAQINRKEIYMTNLIKCTLPKNRKPKQDEIQTCSEYLNKEIILIEPEVIVPLGYHAMRYIFQKFGIDLNSSKVFGKFYYAQEKKIFPVQHPAALCYGDSLLEEMTKNYKKLKVLMSECKWYPCCPLKRYYEIGKLDKKWVELYCRGDWESCVRYHMEERGEP